MDWREKLFGKLLVKCESVSEATTSAETVATVEALADCREEGEEGAVVGVYFSFANISDASDDFGPRLEALHARLRGRLRVVQVVLWAHVGTPDGPAEREAGFRRSLAGKPWLAVPFHEVDTKRRLTQRYGIAVGVPTLVVRGRQVREALLADPAGAAFPWPAPAPADALRGVLLRGLHARTTTYDDLPADAVRIFYFAAHWCPPCRTFAPSLCAMLAEVRRRRSKHANCQLIVVSSDRSEQSFERTVGSVSAAGAWAVPWEAAAARAALGAALAGGALPALQLLDARGAPLARRPRAALAADPHGLNFPWNPRPVSILTEPALLKLARHPALVLFVEDEESEIEFAESVLTPAAESYLEECSVQFPGFRPLASSSSSSSSSEDGEGEEGEEDGEGRGEARRRRRGPRGVQFAVALAGSAAGELLREHLALAGAPPLLAGVDFPRRRLAPVPLGAPLTATSVQNFLDAFRSGHAPTLPLHPYTDKC